jgi:prepilin-type N-terminal cleavage/methylation domain-containing protein/prepilin-type processing-associated H-X9-DG protein
MFGAFTAAVSAGPYAPAAGQPGSTAIKHDDPSIVAWASAVGQLVRGPYDISDSESPLVSFGVPSAALGPANGFDANGQPLTSPNAVVSLGDGGFMTLLFSAPIFDGPLWDFVVFENAFNDTFLELAFVEVSSDGVNFTRFPCTSLTQTTVQIVQTGPNAAVDPTEIDGFAGKYRAGWGTPFDLSVLAGTPGLDLNRITAVRVVDVVGSLDPFSARFDSSGRVINDPWPTPFNTGGFDLDAIGVLHQIPEPHSAALLAGGALALGLRRRRWHQGFTLVELLAAIAVLATLAALGLGVLQAARERGESAKCFGNLRTLASANLAYAAEHDGQYVPAQEPSNTVRWHGVRRGVTGKFDPTQGPLAPYLGEQRKVQLCPTLGRTLRGAATFEDGTGGYGYNAAYIGGTPADPFVPERIVNIAAPSRTVMFADCAFPRAEGLQEYAYAEPWRWADYRGRLRGPLAPSVHFRHRDQANVAWCDGRVSSERWTRLGGRNSYGGEAQKHRIGWFGPEENNGYWRP